MISAPGREDAVAAGDDDGARADRRGGLGRGRELAEQLRRQGVDLRVVEAEDGHAVVTALDDARGAATWRGDATSAGGAARRRSTGRSPRRATAAARSSSRDRPAACGPLVEERRDDAHELVPHPGRAARLELAGGRSRWARCAPIAAHSSSTPSPVGRGGGHHRRPPARRRGEVEHALEVAAGVVGARAVGLVDDEDVGDLEQARLVGLHGVAPARVHDHDGGVGGAGHLHLDLAHADGLDQHPRPAGGVEARARPRGWRATGRRGARGWPSTG